METQKRLCRVREDKAICGVCGGIAEYWSVDPIVVRLGMVLLCFAFGLGLFIYIVLAIIMPVKKDEELSFDSAQTYPDVFGGDFVCPAYVPMDGSAEAPAADPIEAPVADPIEVPAADPIEAPAADPMMEPAEETIVETLAELVSVPTAESVPAPTAESSAATVVEPVADSAAETIVEPAAYGPRTVAASVNEPKATVNVTAPASVPKTTGNVAAKETAGFVAPAASVAQTPRSAQSTHSVQSTCSAQTPQPVHVSKSSKRGGVVLIIFGVALMLKFLIPFLDVYLLGGIAAIVSGIIVVSKK